MDSATPLTWSVVIPVKLLELAKSRLVGLTGEDRAALALAMAADTVAAVVTCPSVGAVIVVTDDPAVRAELAVLGAHVVSDQPGAGLNPALAFGAEYAAGRWPRNGRAGLAGDLPALTAADLAAALTAASAITHAFVADAAGSGTTLYTAGPNAAFCPRFGLQSRELHRRDGATELDLPGLGGLRRDVDTLADLRVATAIGLGPRSARLAALLAVGGR